MLLEKGSVSSHRPVQGAYRILSFETETIAARVRPGQFIHLKVPGLGESVLRRPFSIYQASRQTLSILYKEVGKGTSAMARLKPGDEVSLMGPLGNGFPQPADGSLPILVAGGYGMAALYLVAERSPATGILFAGGATALDILGTHEFESLGWPWVAATVDGSLGETGFVTDALDHWLASNQNGRTPEFFVCGPMGLLKAMAERALRHNGNAWLSLDRHMGCGVGACLACVQRVRTHPGDPKAIEGQNWKWARICKEGPVFESREILWDEEGKP